MSGRRTRSVQCQTIGVRKTRYRKLPSPPLTICHRRPVATSVRRIYNGHRSTDINNNRCKTIVRPPPLIDRGEEAMKWGEYEVPPISFVVGFAQVLLFFKYAEKLGIQCPADICVSWDTVVVKGEVWRLFVAQFFHFEKKPFFFNVLTLMVLGRCLEKKVRPFAYASLLAIMSVMSNVLFLGLCNFFCTTSENDFAVGFSTVTFAFRMIHIWAMDRDSNNGKGDPNLIFGFIPVHLPAWISPWQPVLETLFFDVCILGRCIANNISGFLSFTLVFPYLLKKFRNTIMYPRYPPPPPPHVTPRYPSRSRSRRKRGEN